MLAKSIEAVLTLFILISIGWILSRLKWIKVEEKSFLNKLIIKICIPALTINNLFSSFTREFIISSFKYLLIVFFFYMAITILVLLLAIAFRVNKKDIGTFATMAIVSNSMFFGLPINLSLYGDEGLQYILCFFMINTAVFWSIFAPMIKKGGNKSSDTFTSNLKNILNVPFLTVIISSLLIYNSVKLPNIVLKIAKQLSNLVTPLACIVIGKIIYDIDFNRFKLDSKMILITMVRFLISPILMFTITRLFNLPTIASKVLTVMAAMPIMMQVAIVTDMYDEGNSKYATSAIALTTLVSLFTTPLYAIILDLIL